MNYIVIPISGMNNISPINLAKEARESLGSFCMDVCKAQCCQRGFLLLMNDKEIKTIVGNREKSYLKKGILSPSNNGYFYDSSKKTCKNLDKKNYSCREHNNTSRPLVCRDYPVFLVRDYVMFGKTCVAVEKGMLDSYKKRFEEIGIRVL